ncbi:MAG: acyl-CoA dehydrogenase family protein, partial [Gemmatimonadota bacterium]
MDDALFFNQHHLEVREMVRDFARNEIAPVAREHDATSEFPWATVK